MDVEMCALSDCVLCQQASTPWRKATAKLEGEPEYEDLSKIDRLEVFDEYMRSVFTVFKCHISQPTICVLLHLLKLIAWLP